MSDRSAPALVRRPDLAGAPPPEQLHVQFGTDAASQAVVSWAAPGPAARPRLRLGQPGTGYGREVAARERTYTDALTGETAYTYHAAVGNLAPDSSYVYEAVHDGAPGAAGAFRTGPRGRSAGFRFTSFGDQSIPAPVGQGLGPASANAGYVVAAVESLSPLFHLAYRDLATPYGFAAFDVAPAEPGGTTSITVTHYGAAAGSPDYRPLDRFVLRKPVRAALDGGRLLTPAGRCGPA